MARRNSLWGERPWGAEWQVATLPALCPQAGPDGSEGRAGLAAASDGEMRSGGGGAGGGQAGARLHGALGLGLAASSCPHPHSSWSFLPTVVQPNAAQVHRSCTSCIPAMDTQGGSDGASGISFPLSPRSPPKHTDGAAESSSATRLPDGVGLSQDRALSQPEHGPRAV